MILLFSGHLKEVTPMAEEYGDSYPMKHLESLLKRCFLQRPELSKKILQPSELSDYINWMIRSFADDPSYAFSEEELPHFSTGQMAELGKRILANPRDQKAVTTLSAGYEKQEENRYILSDSFISVGRMLRYMPAHWHKNDYFELYYAFSGDCPIYFQNETIVLRPGAALIIAPGVVHASPCYEDDRVLVYYMLRRSTFEQVFWNQIPSENLMSSFFRRALSGEQSNSYLHFETGNDSEIRELLYKIACEFLEAKAYAPQLMNSMMTTFFLLLLQRYEGTARLPRSENFYWKHEFSAILSYIQANYSRVKIRELAERFHYSERQITRIVQNCTGESFESLVTRLRMERAALLLRNTDTPIGKISQDVGYATISSFYRIFSATYACAPAAYREKHKRT